MKATYREVKDLIDNTEWTDSAFKKGQQPRIYQTGYFTPSNANWSYQIGIAEGNDGLVYEIVTVFGEVKGYRRTWVEAN